MAAAMAALTLKPGLLSSNQDLAKIDNQTVAKGLQLSLTLPGGSGNYPMYAAALLSAEGRPIWTQAHLTRTGRIVVFIDSRRTPQALGLSGAAPRHHERRPARGSRRLRVQGHGRDNRR